MATVGVKGLKLQCIGPLTGSIWVVFSCQWFNSGNYLLTYRPTIGTYSRQRSFVPHCLVTYDDISLSTGRLISSV